MPKEEPRRHIVLGVKRETDNRVYTLCLIFKREEIKGIKKSRHTLFTAKLHSKEQVCKMQAFLHLIKKSTGRSEGI